MNKLPRQLSAKEMEQLVKQVEDLIAERNHTKELKDEIMKLEEEILQCPASQYHTR